QRKLFAAVQETEPDRNQVSQWQTVWEETYSQGANAADPAFDTTGWNSSYSGQPIPAPELREWLDQTINRIVALRPKRVLEIGCGLGMILFNIAPLCDEYCATDFSASALTALRKKLDQADGLRSRVTLLQRPAADFSGMGPDAFDVVILNSVVQYFPSVDYLKQVVEGAAGVVAPGGAISLGDVRNLDLLEAAHSSFQLYKSPSSLPVLQLKQRIQRQITMEKELLLAPRFFIALKSVLPKISRVHIEVKRGCYKNELTRFRYDV